MMKGRVTVKKWGSLLCCMLLSIVFIFSGSTVFASVGFDVSKICSVEITLQSADKVSVPHGRFVLYPVADAVSETGQLAYRYQAPFSSCPADLTDISDETLAQQLCAFIKQEGIAGTEKSADENGTVRFDGLRTGLYLVLERESANGYYAISPFLVSLPMMNETGSEWVYNVTTRPKVEKIPVPETEKPSAPRDPSLPQTGMLRWPIPVLCVAGLLCFAVGWGGLYINRKKKECTKK